MSYELKRSGAMATKSSSFGDMADELIATVSGGVAVLRRLSDADAALPRAEGKWSSKQVLGHLIDSASNNHQRFVRAQGESPLVFPGYEQDHWVVSQRYQQREWGDLVQMWESYNRHLAHVVTQMPDTARRIECMIGTNAPVTLSSLVLDYIGHLQHHLAQLGALA